MAEGYGVCAICLEEILIQEAALVKGCEHAYWFVLKLISFCFGCSVNLLGKRLEFYG